MRRLLALAALLAPVLVACTGGSDSPHGGSGGAGGGEGGARPLACGAEPTVVDLVAAPELSVVGDPGSPRGIFDPSLAYEAGAPRGVLSYSSVSAQDDIHTRIAVSTDLGKTFTFVADANAATEATLPANDANACPSGACEGKLVHEVSSIVDDASDPDPARRYKLFTHQYLVQKGGALRYELGRIALQSAPAPEGPWSMPVNAIGWKSSSPFSSDGAAFLASEHPELSDCAALTEPGALVVPGVGLELFVGCAAVGAKTTIRVVLLRSTDHGATFTYVATPLRPEDAACVGGTKPELNAASPFVAGGLTYVVASPANDHGYAGCAVFPFDPVSGLVARDAGGVPVYVQRLDVSPAGFNGACAYAEGATALGFLVPAASLADPKPFRIFASGIEAP